MSENQLRTVEVYKKWCAETKRNGGVLVGSSIREFLDYLADYQRLWGIRSLQQKLDNLKNN